MTVRHFPPRRCLPVALVSLGLVLLVGACQSTSKPADPEAAAASSLGPAGDSTTGEGELPVAEPPTLAAKVDVAPGEPVQRFGDEIVAAGRFFRAGTPVVLWLDPGGYDGYRVERRFSPLDRAGWKESVADNPALGTPNRYGMRAAVLSPAEREQVRGGGWDLPQLQRVIDQFVLHYDASGTSARCFEGLHDHRGLSIHFLLDVDGTIYQTLDLKERAWHATVSNSRSIGIEIANIGAYPLSNDKALARWYGRDASGAVRLTMPPESRPGLVRTPGFVGRPDRPEPVVGRIHGEEFRQYDFTPEQYAALIRLTAALSAVFPNLPCDYPRDTSGHVVPHKLDDAALAAYRGVLGHFHIQSNKIDPGPALQWERVIGGARRLLGLPELPAPDATAPPVPTVAPVDEEQSAEAAVPTVTAEEESSVDPA